MAINFTCSCGERIAADEQQAGLEVRCSSCGNFVRVPTSDMLSYVAPHSGSLTVSGRAVELFRQTTLWVRIMSILMFGGAGLMVIAGVVIVLFGTMARARFNPGGLVGCIYIPFAVLYIVPAVFLWRFANHSKAFALYRIEQHMDDALQAQKSFWKFTAITALVIFGLYLLIIAIALLIAVIHH